MTQRLLKEKIAMRFSVSQLERIIIALLNNSTNKKFASNVIQLFNIFDEKTFENDFDKQVRVEIIKRLGKLIMDKQIEDKDGLLSFLDMSGKYETQATEILNKLFQYELVDEELTSLDTLVSQQLKLSIIEPITKSLTELTNQLQTETYDDFPSFIQTYEQTVGDLNTKLISARESITETDNNISLSEASFVRVLDQIIKEENSPDARIRIGVQYFNNLVDGGFEKGRLYCACGMAKGWKSGFLLNSAIDAKLYNVYPIKDGLKPVIVYLTQENSIKETILRVWSRCFGNNDELKNVDAKKAANLLEENHIFTPNSPDEAELLVWHRPTGSISTVDLVGMIDDLKKEGKYCVFLVQDYIKRIRSSAKGLEPRLEYAKVTDELCNIAKQFDIPVLTAMQLNRESFRTFNDAEDTMEAKLAAFKKLGAANISESIDIIQNADYSFLLGRWGKPEIANDDEGTVYCSERFLLVKLIACRGKLPKTDTFLHRFLPDNDMCLDQDVNSPRPKSIDGTFVEIAREKSKNKNTFGPRKII